MGASANNLANRTATELMDLYRSGQASPVEATQAVLKRHLGLYLSPQEEQAAAVA